MRKWFFCVLCSSCTLHSPYQRPVSETPTAWRTSLASDEACDIGWWKLLGDEALNRLIDAALANNEDLQVAMARVDEFEAQLGIARSQLFPQVELDLGGNRQKQPTSSGNVITNAFNFVFGASYLVDLWGEVRSAVEVASHDYLASIEARRLVVLTLVSSVANTYVQILQFDRELAIARQTVEDRNRAYHLAQVRFELGLTSELPVAQALSELEIARADSEQFQIAIATSEDLLSVLIGKPSMEIVRGRSLDQLSLPPSVPTVLPSEIVCRRPDIRAAEQKLISAGAQIGVARAKFFPRINFLANFGYNGIELGNLFRATSQVWEYGVDILQEIFTGGRLTSNLRLAQAQQREALHAYLSTILKAFQEVNDALTTHKINLEIVETERIRLEATRKYLCDSDLLYQEGQIDYLTFLDAERQFFQNQIDYETAKGASFLSLIHIYQALGGSWVFDADAQAIKK